MIYCWRMFGRSHLRDLLLFGLASAVFPTLIVANVAAATPDRPCPSEAEVLRIAVPLAYKDRSPDVSVINRALHCMGYLEAPSGLNVLNDVTAAGLRRFYRANMHPQLVVLRPGSVAFDERAKELLLEHLR